MPGDKDADPLHTPIHIGKHQVPGVWRYLFPDDIQDMRFPSECQSTCAKCPKIVQEGFHPDYRCCTYHPTIPNFLLGLALENPETSPLVDALITDGFATPEGVQPTTAQTREALAQRAAHDFGKEHDVVCRFLDVESGRCQIYKYRNGVCSTFFCIHDQGEDGASFWSNLQATASQSEMALAQWAMDQIGLTSEAYFERFDSMAKDVDAHASSTESGWPVDSLRTLWGEWYGREQDFYRSCAVLVRQHKDNLSSIIDGVSLKSSHTYDLAFRSSLPSTLRDELDANGATAGQPIPPADLWYMFKLAHRNLWRQGGR